MKNAWPSSWTVYQSVLRVRGIDTSLSYFSLLNRMSWPLRQEYIARIAAGEQEARMLDANEPFSWVNRVNTAMRRLFIPCLVRCR
jgi:hypothetical protein